MKQVVVLLICLFFFSSALEANQKIKLKDIINDIKKELTKSNKKKDKKPNTTIESPQQNDMESQTYSLNDDIIEFLNIHNKERALFNIPPLEWSQELAKDAEKWAKIIHDKNVLQHASNLDQGENLFWGSCHSFTMADAANSWLSEKRYLKSNYYEPKAGHYTQMIWRKTQKIGAAIVKGKNGTFVVARYFPAGNYIGEPIK